MRVTRWLLVAASVSLAACEQLTGLLTDPDTPGNLTYQLIPSGDPNAPLGVLLMWDVPASGRANAFNVYGRVNGGDWQLRGTTTSPTFHDAGTPEAQYYVATRDANGNELASSNTVTIDLEARLPAPLGLTSISLNGAVQLHWSSNTTTTSPSTFDHYRVYATAYDGSRGVCTTSWVLEGSTISDEFLAGNLTNGVSRCFAVSAITHDGHESLWSDARLDTPRYDSRNVVVYAQAVKPDSAAFLFLDGTTKAIGRVSSATRADADFSVDRHADGSFWLIPTRSGSTVMLYSSSPVSDLTAIDRAPASGYALTALQAQPGFAYVFQLQEADGTHFAAVRVAYVGSAYVVLDWSYQSAPGNPELDRRSTGVGRWALSER